MPENEKTKITPKEGEEKWVTVGGRKVQLKPGEDVEEKMREKLPSARGAKESQTKEAKKSYIHRFNIIKSPFKIRDEVWFDEFKKSGVLYGFDGDNVRILSGNGHYIRSVNDVFKKSETFDDFHWDVISKRDRVELLQKSNISDIYVNRDWSLIPEVTKNHILKNLGPAGYEGGVSTSTAGIWNPVNDDKTVSERVKEAEKQEKEKSKTVNSGATNAL